MKLNIPKNENSKTLSTDYFLLIDNSGSIWNSVSALKETVKAVVTNMHETDTITVATFASHTDFDFFAKALRKNQNILDLVNRKISARGMTNFNDSLTELNTRVFDDVGVISGNTNSVFYFLSDGYANHFNSESETINLCKRLSSKFSAKTIVGYGSNYNRKLLLDMTDAINGTFSHISNYTELTASGEVLVKSKKTVKTIDLDKCYDVIWQVTDSEIIPLVCKDKQVEVLETENSGELFAIDFDEIDALPDDHQLKDGKFVYSLVYILSQKNKANLGVSVLRKAGDVLRAKMLQKSFTVAQKGRSENDLKAFALVGSTINKQTVPSTFSLESFIKSIKDNLGKVSIDLVKSPYKSVTRSGEDASKVEFKTNDSSAKIIGITGNEDRANISFLTVRNGRITNIKDVDLIAKVEEFNKNSDTPIKLPIEAPTFRNYTFVANGDFNYDTISLDFENETHVINPNEVIDLFDENQKIVKVKDFANLYKTLIAEKAHASVLRFYVKKYSKQKNLVDLRVQNYGVEGVKLLEEMGLDSQMRYAPKHAYKPKDENADFVPFIELTAQLKGAATISASKSFEKFEKKGKPNVGDDICWPLFEKYENQLVALGEETFVEFCQKTLEGVEDTVDLLSQKVSSIKFFLMITNSWFVDVDKSDNFEYDGLVINTKIVNEYL
jgi:hypothetical protein